MGFGTAKTRATKKNPNKLKTWVGSPAPILRDDGLLLPPALSLWSVPHLSSVVIPRLHDALSFSSSPHPPCSPLAHLLASAPVESPRQSDPPVRLYYACTCPDVSFRFTGSGGGGFGGGGGVAFSCFRCCSFSSGCCCCCGGGGGACASSPSCCCSKCLCFSILSVQLPGGATRNIRLLLQQRQLRTVLLLLARRITFLFLVVRRQRRRLRYRCLRLLLLSPPLLLHYNLLLFLLLRQLLYRLLHLVPDRLQNPFKPLLQCLYPLTLLEVQLAIDLFHCPHKLVNRRRNSVASVGVRSTTAR